MQQKKTRRGREYLNDFRRDVNGSYLYQGSYRRYTGSMPYAKLRGLLWALCGGALAALAAAMGSLAVQALRSDDEALRQTAEELRQMTDYMVFQIDEELRSREPYDKRRNDPAATRNDLDIALRVASDIPNEVVYIMCRCIELMKEVVDKGDDLTACSALAAVHLSVAAIRCMQAELLSYAKEMDDDVFGYTIVREAELNLANHQELIDGLVEELTRRLTREKK